MAKDPRVVAAFREQCVSRLKYVIKEWRSQGDSHRADRYQKVLDLMNEGRDDEAIEAHKSIQAALYWDCSPIGSGPPSEHVTVGQVQLDRYIHEGVIAFKMYARYDVHYRF